jgi:hypothetical protein
MLLLRACPHCRGDLVLELDRACGYFTCVQCGHILSAEQERALGYHVTKLGALHDLADAHAPRHLPRRARRPRPTSACSLRANIHEVHE